MHELAYSPIPRSQNFPVTLAQSHIGTALPAGLCCRVFLACSKLLGNEKPPLLQLHAGTRQGTIWHRSAHSAMHSFDNGDKDGCQKSIGGREKIRQKCLRMTRAACLNECRTKVEDFIPPAAPCMSMRHLCGNSIHVMCQVSTHPVGGRKVKLVQQSFFPVVGHASPDIVAS